MNTNTRFALCAFAILLSACVSVGGSVRRFGEYPPAPDATYAGRVGTIELRLHPRDSALVLSPPTTYDGGTITQAKLPDEEDARAAASLFLGDTGCTAAPLRQPYQDATWFETQLTCPSGFDLHQALATQRETISRGGSLRR